MTQAKLKIKKGDQVIVTSGAHKGAKGEVINVIKNESANKSRVVVQGVNMVKRHVKPSQTDAGGIVSKEASLNISNVSIVDPKSGNPTRVGYKTLKNGNKVRFAKDSGETLD